MNIFAPDFYSSVLWTMTLLAVVVFLALQKVTAGYGMMRTKAWGPAVGNRTGWVMMETPAFAAMLLLWIFSPMRTDTVRTIFALLFLAHYFQRSFIFPALIRGKSRMPLTIILMGAIFNTINAYMLGGWIFYISPAAEYSLGWLCSFPFIAGTAIFIAGAAINMHSDHIVRHLRKPGDTRHYIPRGGMFRYVASANYFGEFMEWVGFALLTWSAAGAVFALWTFANLAPRAKAIDRRYAFEFGDSYTSLNRKRIIPFIY